MATPLKNVVIVGAGGNLGSHVLKAFLASPASMSTLPHIGRALVAILQNPEITENQYVYVESFTVTQNEVLGALEKATGKKWKGH